MTWLALLKEIEGGQTDTLQNLQKVPSVGFVGALPERLQKNQALAGFTHENLVLRIQRLGDRSTCVESVVDELLTRDLRKDDRHMCLECKHLHGVGNRRYCHQGRHADAVFGSEVPRDMLATLHRCRRFMHYELAAARPSPLK